MDKKDILIRIFEDAGIYDVEEDKDHILELDSLQIINIILGIEEKFLVRVSAKVYAYDNLRTFNDYLKLVENFTR